MSTVIVSGNRTSDEHTLQTNGGWVYFTAWEDGEGATAVMSRADFLAAVETECGGKFVPTPEPLADWERELLAAGRPMRYVPADAIVIDRADVSKAVIGLNHPAPGDVTFDYGEQGHTERIPGGVSWDEWIALGLAIRDAIAHPPVPPVSDEDVETLAGLIQPFMSGYVPDANVSSDLIARRLLATGKVEVTT